MNIIVAGLGAMGSAIAHHLARRGERVLGLDRYRPPHELGSSHGESRVIREAYFEDPVYVPLVRRAYELWHELEQESGEELLLRTGAVMIGREDGAVIQGTLRSAQEHDVAHEVLSATALRQRFPALHPPPDAVAVHEIRGGILRPEQCVRAHLRGATRDGAMLRYDEPMLAWESSATGVCVDTPNAQYRADALVIAAGPWLPTLMPRLPLTVARQPLFWFRPDGDTSELAPGRCPIYLWEVDEQRVLYGFPLVSGLVKVARHHGGELTTAETVKRAIDDSEVEQIRTLVAQLLPSAQGALARSSVCLYTNTPDGNFLVDRHPGEEHVWIVSPCSGHGFKFAPVIGEIVADLVTTGATPHELDGFALKRL